MSYEEYNRDDSSAVRGDLSYLIPHRNVDDAVPLIYDVPLIDATSLNKLMVMPVTAEPKKMSKGKQPLISKGRIEVGFSDIYGLVIFSYHESIFNKV